MTYHYRTSGTCSRSVSFELENGILHNVTFEGGCSGNTQGLSHLVEGMKADEVEKRLSGIRCGMRPTSCPDQLAAAIRSALKEG